MPRSSDTPENDFCSDGSGQKSLAAEELGDAQGVVLVKLEGLVGCKDGAKPTVVAVADDDQVSSLAAGVQREVVITRDGTVFQIVSQMCISSYWKWSTMDAGPFKDNAVANPESNVQWKIMTPLTMRFRFTWSVTASVADNDHWYSWMHFDIDQRMLLVGIVLGHEERGPVQLFRCERATRYDFDKYHYAEQVQKSGRTSDSLVVGTFRPD
jgi:hypothetical protein